MRGNPNGMNSNRPDGWRAPAGEYRDGTGPAWPDRPRPTMSRPGVPANSGMRVSGYSADRKPSLYDKNPLATMTLVTGFVAMVSTLIPNIGAFIAIPMGACTTLLGILGIASAKKRGNDRGDIAVAGIVLGIASIIVAVSAIIISQSILSNNGTDSIAIATESGDESLEVLAASKASADAFSDIVGNDWGTGETRNKSSEVISLKKDMTFMAWTVGYDGSLSEWSGQYSLYIGKSAYDIVPDDAREVIQDEIERSPKFAERSVVAIQMTVNEIDGDRSNPVTLVMIGHYLKDSHQMFMREANGPQNTPTVLNLLDDHEAGIT